MIRRALGALGLVALSRLAVLVVQKSNAAGLDTTYANAAGGGDSFPWAGRRSLHVINGSGASINVTLVAQKPCSQGVLHNRVVAVPAGQDRLIGDIGQEFVDANGYVQVTYSAVTTVTVAVLES